MLDNIQYAELDSVKMTWCATAEVRAVHSYHNQVTNICLSAPQIAYNQRQLQRTGVRLLLQALLKKLAITDSLDESGFPYRLIDSQYYVCFSHTGVSIKNVDNKSENKKKLNTAKNKVAVVISRHHAVGIDIEINTVKWLVAQRFYHPNEMFILQTLPIIQRKNIVKLLWQIKESFIKINQYTLAQGLGMDYSSLIAELINANQEDAHLKIVIDDENYHIAFLSSQQTVIVY